MFWNTVLEALNNDIVRGTLETGVASLVAILMYYVGQFLKNLPTELHSFIPQINAVIAMFAIALPLYAVASPHIPSMNLAELIGSLGLGAWGSKVVHDTRRARAVKAAGG
jgi:uncharacterized membrane protein YoaK (UPF0700 family)